MKMVGGIPNLTCLGKVLIVDQIFEAYETVQVSLPIGVVNRTAIFVNSI